MKWIKIGVLLVLSNLVWANPPFETFAELTEKAERGDAMAQTILGTAYHFGQEKEYVAKDYRKALYWYQKAAMQNNAIACYQLGIMYKFGRGVEQDKTKAFHWFLKSAELGEHSAQSEVAFAYYAGEGINKDYRKAFYWFKRVADEQALYQEIVGIMYKNGLGVEQDQTLAFHYFNQAFQLKPYDAKLQEELALRYYFGNGVAKNEQQGFKLFLKAAKQGQAESQYQLARIYFYGGAGVSISAEQALYWAVLAANQGHQKAQTLAGAIFVEFKKYEQAFYWFQKALEQDDPNAYLYLGMMAEFGLHIKEDREQAKYYYQLACEKGIKEACEV